MKNQGFTIVEVVIVVIVIGIITAVSVVGFGAWRSSVATKEVQSDLNGVIAGMDGNRNFDEDGYPIFPEGTVFDSNNSIFKPSDDVTLTYIRGDADSYCIEAQSTTNPAIIYFFNAANGNKEIKQGECPETLNNGIVSTLVNGGLNYPTGIAVDSTGHLYVAETGNNRILKITPAGVVSVFAGATTAGYLDANGTAARFNEPYGVAVDAADFVYVVDYGNSRIRKISQAGDVTTFAGSTQGFLDATGTSARFYHPYGIVIEQATGTSYVTETGNARIRKITAAGVVTTFAGSTNGYQDGTGSGAQFDDPIGIAIHTDGNLYVVEYESAKIRKITPGAVVTTIAGSTNGFADGIGAAARFYNPTGIGIQNNIAFIADSDNNRVRMLNVNSLQVLTLAGSGLAGNSDDIGNQAQFNDPTGIVVDQNEVVYIVESGTGKIRKIQ